MPVYILLLFCFSFVISLATTPMVAKLALAIGATDIPNQRKVHHMIMPRLGGLSVYLGFMASSLFLLGEGVRVAGVLLGGTVILCIGIADDIKSVSPIHKLLFQALAAGLVVSSGITINFVSNPFDGRLQLGILSVPLTIIWIIALTNAINLIDGLDGLASGVSLIALLTFALIAFQLNNITVLLLSLSLAGAVLGFLRHNFFPAKIFLGDSGSMFLGFMISVFAIIGWLKSVTVVTFIVPIVILGVPIIDTCFAILRRYLEHKPIFQADRQHIHHRLLNLGFSHRKTVLAIYCIALFFSASALLMMRVF